MQTVEAMLSLLLVLSLVPELVPAPASPPDDTLYRLQLAGDAWRVLHLRGDLRGLGNASRGTLEADLGQMGEQTGLCFFLEGVEMTNCRSGEEAHEMSASMRRTVIFGGTPRNVTFSLGR